MKLKLEILLNKMTQKEEKEMKLKSNIKNNK